MARRKAKKATVIYLERVALWYLSRYPGSVERVTQALKKRVRRSVKELDTDPAEGARNIATVIAKLKAGNFLNDTRFATSRVRTMRRRGNSARAIGVALRRQGIAPEVIEAVLAEAKQSAQDEEEGDPELRAAMEMVRRKRLGWRRENEEERALKRQKDLAKLARAGFSYRVAQEALVAEFERER